MRAISSALPSNGYIFSARTDDYGYGSCLKLCNHWLRGPFGAEKNLIPHLKSPLLVALHVERQNAASDAQRTYAVIHTVVSRVAAWDALIRHSERVVALRLVNHPQRDAFACCGVLLQD
uniref:WGS project CAFE00000000 data, contig n=1 Tax=Heterorhabditis bacteriophora TaxID=37862 RepID=A0A1I7WD00_HETBA